MVYAQSQSPAEAWKKEGPRFPLQRGAVTSTSVYSSSAKISPTFGFQIEHGPTSIKKKMLGGIHLLREIMRTPKRLSFKKLVS